MRALGRPPGRSHRSSVPADRQSRCRIPSIRASAACPDLGPRPKPRPAFWGEPPQRRLAPHGQTRSGPPTAECYRSTSCLGDLSSTIEKELGYRTERPSFPGEHSYWPADNLADLKASNDFPKIEGHWDAYPRGWGFSWPSLFLRLLDDQCSRYVPVFSLSCRPPTEHAMLCND